VETHSRIHSSRQHTIGDDNDDGDANDDGDDDDDVNLISLFIEYRGHAVHYMFLRVSCIDR